MPEKQYHGLDPFYFPSSPSSFSVFSYALLPDCSATRGRFSVHAQIRFRPDLISGDDIVGSKIPKFHGNEILDKTASSSFPTARLTYFAGRFPVISDVVPFVFLFLFLSLPLVFPS